VLLEPWILVSFGLYALTGLCWPPVVWLQVQMRRTAVGRHARAWPAGYRRLARIWFALGWPAFAAMFAVIWLMIFKPRF
jgi:uncharacterized membrane protein